MTRSKILPVILLTLICRPAEAQDGAQQGSGGSTAQKLSNPIADLISIPFQDNLDFGRRGPSYTANVLDVQPVIPIRLNDRLNLISRTVLPIVTARGTTGLGDTVQSLFLSPRSNGGLTYGAGPVASIPTATRRRYGYDQLGLGPTAVVVYITGPILVGALANHLWNVTSRPGSRERLDQTLIQPFAAYTLPSQTSFVLESQSQYDWAARKWTVPINLTANQVVKLGKQLVQFGVGPRYYVDRPPGGERWGLRVAATLVYPVAEKP